MHPLRPITAWCRRFVERAPWWAGIALAGLAWLLLHRLAMNGGLTFTASNAGARADPNALSKAAAIAQYLVPIACLAASVVGVALRRSPWPRASGHDRADPDHGPFAGMTSRDFRLWLEGRFRDQGYQVGKSDGTGDDASADFIVRRHRETVLVHCRQWNAARIGVDVVQAIYQAVARRGAASGLVIGLGRFSRDAVAFAKGCNVKLIDRRALETLFGPVRKLHPGAAIPPDFSHSRPA